MVSQATDETPAEPGLERILTTAIDLFGRHGVKATSVRAIAEQAGVSPPLVIHHYGSKEKLREACDDRVLAFIRESKAETMRAGLGGPPIQVDTRVSQARPALRYLARTLSEGSPRLDEFVDDLVEDAVGYTAQGVETGLVLPSANPRARVVILTLWSLGALVLHEHMQRLLGEDLIGEGSTDLYTQTMLELFSEGLLTERAKQAFIFSGDTDDTTEETA
ncbi:TetR family transcriptional regulator [Serinicoccus marinus]|uniref:TetR family transcriptional regulator n=1 Tax=Serinicoccus marinus TaxID=247333 RepID=UPI0003B3A997|nr:TetR family transcriptional regulator [Serinicoccus marinus]